MNHYDQLGVTPDADAATIKRAYRAKAKAAHPDAGGSADEFAPMAKAYEVLSDPARRLLYDTTGQDQRTPIEQEVQGILMEGFSRALAMDEDVEIVAFVRNGLKTRTRLFPDERKQLEARKKKLTAKRKKIKAKGINGVHLIIDGELKGIDAQLANLEHQSEVSKACLAALDSYKEEWEAPPPLDITIRSIGRTTVQDILNGYGVRY